VKFIHTSDWHVGASKFLPDYLQRQEEVIDSIFTLAKKHAITTVCVAGDIFDTDNPNQVERDLVQKKLIAYDKAGFNILLIPGNHDMSDMLGYTAIHYLALLHNQGKFHNSTITEKTAYRIIDDTLFILLCHTPRQFKRDYENAIAEVRNSSLKLNFRHIVVVMHETLKGALTDTNWRMQGDLLPPLEYGEEMEDCEVTYNCVGDIHIKQRIAKNTFYCGAPLQVKFGDQWPKGVLIVDTEDPNNPVFQPIESKQLVKVSSLENIPENAHVKLATDKVTTLGLALPSNVVKVEYVKPDQPDSVLDLSRDLSLHQILVESVSQTLEGEDLILAKKEIDEIIQQVQKAD
jgi:exonuclease SbcD